MHDMQSFRQLQQATNTSADGGSSAAPAPAAPAPPAATAQQPVPAPTATAPAPVAAGPPDITIVTTARDLQQASLNPNTTDIEIRSHLDMRDLERPRNPDMPGSNSALRSNKQALIYASKPLRSIRGNCSDPAAAAALNLTAAEADQLLPIKPFQCLIVVDDTWLMVNNGVVWVDNLHLKIIRRTVQPILPFISAGLQSADTPIGASQIYATNITFQAEHRGSASAIFVDINEVAVYVDDCIVSDWAGFRSPFVVKFQSVLHIRNTIFLNSYLYSELVDVSFEGIVRFEAVSLANVSLTDGAVVDTTLNDYQQAIAYYLNYYAEDDEAYDVEVEPVPAASRGMFGAEFVIPNATMSDCVYTLGAGPGVVYPGCPPESEAARERLKSRSLGSSGGEPLDDGNPSAPGEDYSDYVASVPLDEDFIGGQGVPFPADYQGDYAGVPLAVAPGTVGGDYSYDPNDWFDERLLQADDPWLVATRQVLPQRLPTPETWPPFTFERAPLQNRTSLLPPTPAVSPQDAAHFLGPLNLTAGPVTTSAAARDIDEGPGAAGIAGIVLGCLAVAVVATMLAVWASRRGAKPHPKGGDSHAGEAMLVGFTSDTTTDASQSTGQAGARLPRGALIPEDYPADDGKQVNSVMNPSARYDMSKPDPGPIIFGEDLKASKTGTKSGFLPDGSPMSEQPALIYFSSTQPSDESRDDESNHSDSGTVLGAHHRRMMQSFSKPDPEPASPLASASTQDRTPPRTGPTRRGGPGPGLGGANGTVDGTIDDGTVDGTIDQTTLSASDAASPSPLGPPAEIRSAAARGSLAPVTEPGEETTVPRSGAEEHALRRLLRRLDTFKRQDLLLGKYQVLGRQQQRLGGQAVVQFVRGAKDRRHYAVKFFLDPDAFFVEAALYAACFPEIQKTVSPEIAARAVDVAAASSGDDKIGAVAIPTATARFLPQVEAVCDGSAGDLVDPSGRQLPPCIVMEKGESLQDWSSRAEPDFFTVLSVLSNISLRLADMHDAGYVHRDLKPANVMWLPRENRWTVIDFGCVAGVGEVAPLSFTLAYAPPEVVAAFLQDKCQIESTPALDAWSLGVMAYEMLSGESAFDFLTHGRCRVIAQLRGELPLPWEQDTDEGNRNKLGAFKGPVLQLLQRDPARRVSMRRFHDVCSRLFASRTAEAQEGA